MACELQDQSSSAMTFEVRKEVLLKWMANFGK